MEEKCAPHEPLTNSLIGKEIDLRTVYNLEYTPKVGISCGYSYASHVDSMVVPTGGVKLLRICARGNKGCIHTRDAKCICSPEHVSFTGDISCYQTFYYHPFKDLYPSAKREKSSPLNDAYLEYLVPREDMADKLPDGVPYEDVDCVLHRVGVKWRPDVEIVRKSHELPPQSEYQDVYCLPGDYESDRSRSTHHVPLPDNWRICQTTQCGSYRIPSEIATFDLTPPKPEANKDTIVPNEKEREIRRVRTGESNYSGTIGSLGDFILREKLYGEVRAKGMSKWEAKRRLKELQEIGVDAL